MLLPPRRCLPGATRWRVLAARLLVCGGRLRETDPYVPWRRRSSFSYVHGGYSTPQGHAHDQLGFVTSAAGSAASDASCTILLRPFTSRTDSCILDTGGGGRWCECGARFVIVLGLGQDPRLTVLHEEHEWYEGSRQVSLSYDHSDRLLPGLHGLRVRTCDRRGTGASEHRQISDAVHASVAPIRSVPFSAPFRWPTRAGERYSCS